MPQRFESARSLGVVLQQENVYIQQAEKLFGDGVVASFRVPAAAAISAADMQSDRDVFARDAGECGVIPSNRVLHFPIRIKPRVPDVFALLWIEVMRVVWRVELDVPHPLGEDRKSVV